MDREGGLPKVMKMKRKPKGVGCAAKTVSDALFGLMIGVEINEGKTSMTKKRWQAEHGATTATTLRLTQPWCESVLTQLWCALLLVIHGSLL